MGKCHRLAYMTLFSYLQVLKTEEKQVVMTVEDQLSAALAEVENLRMTITEKDCMIQDLQNKFLWLRKKVFGRMSEKSLPVDPAQLSLFDEKHLTDEERAQLDRKVEEAEKTITKTITVKAKPSRRPLDITGLPEKVVHLSRRSPRRKRPPQG